MEKYCRAGETTFHNSALHTGYLRLHVHWIYNTAFFIATVVARTLHSVTSTLPVWCWIDSSRKLWVWRMWICKITRETFHSLFHWICKCFLRLCEASVWINYSPGYPFRRNWRNIRLRKRKELVSLIFCGLVFSMLTPKFFWFLTAEINEPFVSLKFAHGK